MKKFILIFILLCSVINSGILFAGILPSHGKPVQDAINNINDSTNYINIGGHLFAGAYPINNPVSTGDTGIVYLYRLINNYLIPIDTTEVTTFGYFTFSQILPGEYVLKANLSPNSTRYKDFFPTYYTSSLKWNLCDHLKVKDTSAYEVNINLVQTVDSLSGPASMIGFVVQSTKDMGFKKLANAEIILFDVNMFPLIYTFSDINGNFSFLDLPFGTYNLMAESAGKFPALLKVTLDENHPVFDSLVLEVLSHAPMNIVTLNRNPRIESIPVFPNPTRGNINLVLRSGEPENLIIEIYSMTGQKVYLNNCQINGIKSVSVPLDLFSDGYYFLMLRSEDGQWSQTQRFLKF